VRECFASSESASAETNLGPGVPASDLSRMSEWSMIDDQWPMAKAQQPMASG
jgi:hypothetical protein